MEHQLTIQALRPTIIAVCSCGWDYRQTADERSDEALQVDAESAHVAHLRRVILTKE